MSTPAPLMMLSPRASPSMMMMPPAIMMKPKPRNPIANLIPVMTPVARLGPYVEMPETRLDKLLLTAAMIVPLAVFIWGAIKFHACGSSGWVIAGLKQLGVHVGVGIGYGAVVAAFIGTLRLWSSARTTAEATDILKPWGAKGAIIMHVFVAVATFIIFRDSCRY